MFNNWFQLKPTVCIFFKDSSLTFVLRDGKKQRGGNFTVSYLIRVEVEEAEKPREKDGGGGGVGKR